MLTIRPERIEDYPAIAEVNILAFEQRLTEALIVTLSRHYQRFDPQLSLVAEQDNKIVGHALFTPTAIRLLNTTVNAVCLAPIAVHPDYQKQGIGGKLIAEGHALARQKGYVLSFLVGHTTYYPRFGYQTFAYGLSEVTAFADDFSSMGLETRKPEQGDLPALRALWEQAEGGVDFALVPQDSLLEWISPNPAITCMVYLHDGQIVGYTRIHTHQPDAPRVFLAVDDDSARAIAGHIVRQFRAGKVGMLKLPLHPASNCANAFHDKPIGQAWEAAMAISLTPNPFDDYYAQVQAKQRPPGRPIWPVAFDLE